MKNDLLNSQVALKNEKLLCFFTGKENALSCIKINKILFQKITLY